MKYISSTYEIMALKVLGRGVDERWIDWALEMISAGFETEQLLILAGELKPYNQFYLNDITSKLFRELQLDLLNEGNIIDNLILHLVDEAISGQRTYSSSLGVIQQVYIERDYDSKYSDFYELYFAADDLKHSEVQWYWPDADRENIDEIIANYFDEWRKSHDYIDIMTDKASGFERN